ncbi:MAG: RNA polymerase sigma factor [Calditrichaceae bacterium]|nr:RNA polymerase sigma factor [Calditrichaceae bacterium]
MNEKALIRKVLNGDRNAFGKIVREYEPVVAATVYGMVGRCPEAEDIGQEVFIRFYNALGQFRGDSTIKTYLTRIAINLSLNELNRRKRRKQLFETSVSEKINDIKEPEETSWKEDKEIINKAMEMLDEKYKSVLILRLINGYSTREAAQILKLPEGTVLSRLSRAQEKLKSMLTSKLRENHHEV